MALRRRGGGSAVRGVGGTGEGEDCGDEHAAERVRSLLL